ncbi:hypothetical protein [Arthrobacter sp. ok909]|uniref:hypothetical protein n=1 Tax=Arthrobacter sp. ok909 TaxID=1761746 RepID=UPI000B0AEC48
MKSLQSDEVVAVRGVLTDTHPVDFHALGLTGAIDRLTLPSANAAPWCIWRLRTTGWK